MAKRKNTEALIQKALAYYLRVLANRGDVLFTHIANEGKMPIQYRMKLKRLGTTPGAPDLLILTKTSRTIFVELKTKKGRLSENQKKWRDFCKESNIEWFLIKTNRADEALIELKEILKKKDC